MVEFALVAPMFFLTLFATIDGGLFLYGRETANDAAKTAMLTVAAEGRTAGGDSVAVSRVAASPAGTSSLVTISEIDIYRAVEASDGTLSPDNSNTCGSANDKSCRNRYDLHGNVIGGASNWLAVQRNVSSGTTDFFGVDIQYTYSHYTDALPAIKTTLTMYFRLEPES